MPSPNHHIAKSPNAFPPEHDIRIGTLCGRGKDIPGYVRQIAPLGFESFQINFAGTAPEGTDFERLGLEVRDAIADADSDAIISGFGIYGNPVEDEPLRRQLEQAIDACEAVGCDVVASFAGGLKGFGVEKSIEPWAEAWRPLVERAGDRGVKLVIENCVTSSTWHRVGNNMGYCPAAWELMFNEIDEPHLGLEWEPAHQMRQLIDPIAQLRKWAPKVLHVHGKDATTDHDRLRREGVLAGQGYHQDRHPGLGDCDWTDIISILRQAGYTGTIDIEGWHDPIYRKKLEMTGQVHALRYLQHARGGDFITPPQEVWG